MLINTNLLGQDQHVQLALQLPNEARMQRASLFCGMLTVVYNFSVTFPNVPTQLELDGRMYAAHRWEDHFTTSAMHTIVTCHYKEYAL